MYGYRMLRAGSGFVLVDPEEKPVKIFHDSQRAKLYLHDSFSQEFGHTCKKYDVGGAPSYYAIFDQDTKLLYPSLKILAKDLGVDAKKAKLGDYVKAHSSRFTIL